MTAEFPFEFGFWLYEQATWPEPHRFAGAAWSPSFWISGPRLAAQLRFKVEFLGSARFKSDFKGSGFECQLQRSSRAFE